MLRPAVLVLAIMSGALPAAAQTAAGKGPGCDLANADTVAYGIKLGDGESTRRAIGPNYKIVLSDLTSDYAWLIFASRDNKQLLRLRHHAGDTVNSYMEIEVKYGRDSRKPMQLPPYEFISGKGAKLGMTRKQIVALFGPCFKSTIKAGTEIIRYEIAVDASELTSPTLPPMLKAANMPQYYAEYEFSNGRLVRFAFGHEPV